MESGKINLTIESDLSQVQHVGEAVRVLSSQLELDGAMPSSVELAVVEAVNNSIEHAYASECGNTVEVSFEYDKDCLQISISDYGTPMPRKIVEMLDQSEVRMPSGHVGVDSLPESGWGVQLLKSVCHRVSYARCNRKNNLSLSFKRAAEKHPITAA